MEQRQVWWDSFTEAREVVNRVLSDATFLDGCVKFSELLIETFRADNKLLICGNGGSHCDALHFAEELTGRYRDERQPLPAIALGSAPHITCVGNDYGFAEIFAREVLAFGRPGDLLVVLSTSGNSENVVRAVMAARERAMNVVGLLGRSGGRLKDLVDLSLVVPATTSDRIQEVHIKIIHTVIETAERALFPGNYK